MVVGGKMRGQCMEQGTGWEGGMHVRVELVGENIIEWNRERGTDRGRDLRHRPSIRDYRQLSHLRVTYCCPCMCVSPYPPFLGGQREGVGGGECLLVFVSVCVCVCVCVCVRIPPLR